MKNNRAQNRPNGYKNMKRSTQDQPKKRDFLTAKLFISDTVPNDVSDECIKILSDMKWNKLSYPLSAPRQLFDSRCDDDTKLMTIGYIRDFDPNTLEFTLAVFNNNYDDVAAIKNRIIELIYTSYNGRLGTITKINLIPGETVGYDEDEDSAEDAPADEDLLYDASYNEQISVDTDAEMDSTYDDNSEESSDEAADEDDSY